MLQATCVDGGADAASHFRGAAEILYQEFSDEQLLRAIPRFRNRGNYCYQIALTNSLIALSLVTGRDYGGVCALLGTATMLVLSENAWMRQHLEEWPEAWRQHDIAEFAQYLLPKLEVSVAQWECRTHVASAVTCSYRR